MHFTSFINHLKSHVSLPGHLINELRNHCESFSVPDGTTLIEPGKRSKFIYFIDEGLFRTYILEDNLEKTMDFSGPNEFVGGAFGFYKKTPVDIGAISHSKVTGIKIGGYEFQVLCEDYPILGKFQVNYLLKQLTRSHRDIVIARTRNTGAKLALLRRAYPEIIDIVSHKLIGDYYGTTELQISNIVSKMRKSS